MPLVDATAYPLLGRVLVQVDWSDVPSALCTRVDRVIDATGVSAPLRAYVWPCSASGEYLHLSDGHAVFWDTEAPLDVAFHYEAVAVDSSGAAVLAVTPTLGFDTYQRNVANSWGLADSGQTYTLTGLATQYSVNGNQGVQSHSAPGVARLAALQIPVSANVDVTVTVDSPVPTGAGSIDQAVRARYDPVALDDVELAAIANVAGTVTGALRNHLGGVETASLVFPAVAGAAAGDVLKMRLQVQNAKARCKIWPAALAEPDAWQATAGGITDLDLTVLGPGTVTLNSTSSAGITNATPFTVTFDNLVLSNLDPAPTDPMTAVSGSVTLASLDGSWLRDPVRPCNDLRIVTCWPRQDPVCVPGTGVFWNALDQETYAANSEAFLPTNSARPIAISRARRDADTGLRFLSRRFTDRDAMLTLTAPGSPLLFSTQPKYGVPDRYMDVQDVGVGRLKSDHRYEPRVLTLPYTTVDRPVGTTQGICGNRVADLCDTYDTWDEVTAAGLTFGDLILGAAGAEAPDLGFATWDDVQATHTDWDDVQADGDWDTIKGGP